MSAIKKISHDDLLEYVRNELVCTIGSKCVPLTVPVIITMFRDDTDQDLKELAVNLGHVTIEAFLQSKEISDIISSDYTDKALGISSKIPEKELVFQVNQDLERVKHVLNSIAVSQVHSEELKYRRQRHLLNDPRFIQTVLDGKKRLLTIIRDLDGENKAVNYQLIQAAYQKEYGTQLNPEELAKFFKKKQIKSVLTKFLSEDLDMLTDKNQTGSLFVKLSRPFDEIMEEAREAAEIRTKPPTNFFGNGKYKKKKAPPKLVPPPPPKPKREKIPPPPPKQKTKIPPPPPKEKKSQNLVPIVKQTENLYTTDQRLAEVVERKPFHAVKVETAEKKEVEIDIDELMRQKRRKEYMDRPRSYLNDEGFSNQRMKKTAPKPIKIIADQANARANIDEKDISQAQSRKMNFSSRPRTYLEKDEEEQAATSKQLQKTKKERPKYTKGAAGKYTDDESVVSSEDDENQCETGTKLKIFGAFDKVVGGEESPKSSENAEEIRQKVEQAWEFRHNYKDIENQAFNLRMKCLEKQKEDKKARMGEKIISQFENNAKQNKPFIPSKYKKKAEFDRGGGGHHNKNRQQLDSD